MNDDNLTTEHELFVSIGLKTPVKPSVFRDEIDSMIFENIGYMQSWGVHTKHEYINIYESLEKKLGRASKVLNWIEKKFEDEWTYECGTGEVVEEIMTKLRSAIKS
jgi:hypothetical protein